ncbi:FAD/NAD-P-binding domain-containing protein [Auriscalpium vulgare]|uniref:FAD/NAD-P-binding domain-containing protein n=1 Tax=Auriscalpium vulgare TaxID=40419 RepID=A0ACB8RN23_9AGAM|nr:FAD/NAD-P-binding domain-containing protein [Auriscalpium vulgare]
MASQHAKKNVVVVGGGGAGAPLARVFSQKLDPSKHTLTLITTHEFAIHLPGAVRMTTTAEEKLEDTALIPLDKLLANGNGVIKIGRAIGVQANKGAAEGGIVTLESGETVAYDVLVLAPGSHWQGAIDFPDGGRDKAIAHINAWREKFASARHVLLVGGGAVGQEFAGEIKDFYPDTKVTIVHSEPLLLNATYPDKFRIRLANDLRARGVELVLGDVVDDPEIKSGKVATRGGKQIETDLVVLCRGGKPATEWLKGSLESDAFNEEGRLRVEPTLLVKGYKNIYAAGDVTDWKEQKQVAKYDAHNAVIVSNTLAYLAGSEPTSVYKGSTEIIVITNGRYWGLGYVDALWGIVINSFFSSLIKGRWLLVSLRRKAHGL